MIIFEFQELYNGLQWLTHHLKLRRQFAKVIAMLVLKEKDGVPTTLLDRNLVSDGLTHLVKRGSN